MVFVEARPRRLEQHQRPQFDGPRVSSFFPRFLSASENGLLDLVREFGLTGVSQFDLDAPAPRSMLKRRSLTVSKASIATEWNNRGL